MSKYWSRGDESALQRSIEAASARMEKQVSLPVYRPGKHMARIDFAVP